MVKYSTSEVLEQAVQTEKLGCALYLEMTKRFEKDDKLRQLFETLAVKEQEHEKIFADLKEQVSERKVENWEEVSQYLRAIVESEFFIGKDKALPSLEHLNNIEDAVKYAISFEKETLLYFYTLKDFVRDQAVIDKLINEEKSHIVWLSEFRKSLTK